MCQLMIPTLSSKAHRDFVDVTVELFVKHRAEQWVKLDQYPIARQSITD